MNKYQTKFVIECITNQKPIMYRLTIVTHETIIVEELLEFIKKLKTNYHEKIADELFKKFGGKQTMTANHHGVLIKTKRYKWDAILNTE